MGNQIYLSTCGLFA